MVFRRKLISSVLVLNLKLLLIMTNEIHLERISVKYYTQDVCFGIEITENEFMSLTMELENTEKVPIYIKYILSCSREQD